MNVGEGAAFQS